MSPSRTLLLLSAPLLAIAAALVTTDAFALEEPEYTIVETFEEWELRRYEPYLVAETVVDGDLRQSGNGAFRILAGYIFGDNEPEQKMAMTAPVLSEADEEGYRYQFVMEQAYTMDTLPAPNNALVELKAIPERLVAALRFSGTWKEEKIADLTTNFLEELDRAGYRASADPLFARYNPPFTPWFMRRNEILIEVEPRS